MASAPHDTAPDPGPVPAPAPRPLDGIRVLALEQMQAAPFATLMLARLGAEVIKVESPSGESGRAARPAVLDASGRPAGATFLRYNLGKRSIAVDLKSERGRDLVHGLSRSCDVVVENLGPGRAARLGLGYPHVSAEHPSVVYLSITGFGADGASPYADWPAYAGVAEAMSGIYEHARRPGQPPVINPMGGLGDTGSGLFGVIGVLAALRQREHTGRGQLVDVAMFDAMVAICDIVPNFWSLGVRRDADPDGETGSDAGLRMPYILSAFQVGGRWCYIQVSREHQFERLARLLDRESWLSDPRFADRFGWHDHWPDVIRPALEQWSKDMSALTAAGHLAEAGITAAPCNSAEDVVGDPHLAQRNMLVPIPRTDGPAEPVLVAGNPVKLSEAPELPETAPPLVGQDTRTVLTELLRLPPHDLDALEAAGVIAAPDLDRRT
ncbi:CaiB/BaiF CoA transferase family protein [Yinghuangia soli]|uniref:CoA transferase n=1 Tax=Yinghuangia soli TaxID=2908204 RepID=A0AA41Q8D2_9ACTN|nr:CoA transferase [Yinghuangia soli]MCF2533333.1 CoA transferase [Yinghuangia soli]